MKENQLSSVWKKNEGWRTWRGKEKTWSKGRGK